MKKIKLPTPIWVQLYGDISSYVEEYGSIDNRFDDNGNRLEEYQDEFCTITDNVENIMEQFFEKSDDKDDKEQEVRPTSLDLAKAIQDFAYHELDVITDSDWFDDLVENKVKQQLQKSKQ
tara:strand:+ start:5198 stop:5557 length:360 start_codon:yes stop_codon:yes gene_type:complete